MMHQVSQQLLAEKLRLTAKKKKQKKQQITRTSHGESMSIGAVPRQPSDRQHSAESASADAGGGPSTPLALAYADKREDKVALAMSDGANMDYEVDDTVRGRCLTVDPYRRERESSLFSTIWNK